MSQKYNLVKPRFVKNMSLFSEGWRGKGERENLYLVTEPIRTPVFFCLPNFQPIGVF